METPESSGRGGTPEATATSGDVEEILRAPDPAALRELTENLHPSDLADMLEELDEPRRLRFVDLLPTEIASRVLAEMEEVERPGELLARLPPERIGEVVAELADDDAADLIGELDAEGQARVLGSLRDASEIRELLHYPEDTAGGIMTRELVAISSRITAGEALDAVRGQASVTDDFYTIFVVDPDSTLRGIVTLQSLVLNPLERPVIEFLQDPAAVVPVEMDQEEVGRILSRYNLVSIGVVDPLNRLVGRITFDDVIDVIESETTEDILRFASVSEEEEIRGTTMDAVRSRLPWLVIYFGVASLAASVVYVYQDTIEQLVLLAAIMPIIAGEGGNTGTQALAVTVRRIALADESLSERWSVVGKELLVGVINGFLIGAVVAVAGYLLDGRPIFGGVVMIAMWANLIVASFLGAFVPILLEQIGVDPAVASSIFVTSITDLCGFFLLLGLATAVLL